MFLNFNLGGLTSSHPHLSNPAGAGVNPQQLDKLSPTSSQRCRKPQSAHLVYRLVVSSGCDVELSSAQSCWQDYWTIIRRNRHHIELIQVLDVSCVLLFYWRWKYCTVGSYTNRKDGLLWQKNIMFGFFIQTDSCPAGTVTYWHEILSTNTLKTGSKF